jgi:hypothetical protein
MIIYKYPITPMCDFQLPKDAQTLTVQVQHGEPVMWVKFDPDAPKITRHFVALPTGSEFPDEPINYINTFQLPNGLVFHVFEVLK